MMKILLVNQKKMVLFKHIQYFNSKTPLFKGVFFYFKNCKKAQKVQQ
jgi:hypothetical protein